MVGRKKAANRSQHMFPGNDPLEGRRLSQLLAPKFLIPNSTSDTKVHKCLRPLRLHYTPLSHGYLAAFLPLTMRHNLPRQKNHHKRNIPVEYRRETLFRNGESRRTLAREKVSSSRVAGEDNRA